eukprot:716865-Prymnesium_polylepis.1
MRTSVGRKGGVLPVLPELIVGRFGQVFAKFCTNLSEPVQVPNTRKPARPCPKANCAASSRRVNDDVPT